MSAATRRHAFRTPPGHPLTNVRSAMRNRILGILLAILTVVGGLNLVQAVRRHFTSEHRTSAPATTTVDDFSKKWTKNGVYLDRTFPVSDGQMLVVDVQHADVEVTTGATDQAHLTVKVNASSESRAREIFDHMRFEAFQDGDRIVLRSKPTDDWEWNGRFSIDVLAQIPQRFDLDVSSTHGDVALESVDGTVTLNTTHGDVDAERIAGPSIRMESTHGEIHANALLADELAVQTTHGDISVGSIRSSLFRVFTTHSDIDIAELEGAGELQTTHGDVSAGILKNGGLQIQTTHGDVEIALPADVVASVDFRGERVDLSSVFSFDGVREKDHAKGNLNGGGQALTVSTTFGEVSVHSR